MFKPEALRTLAARGSTVWERVDAGIVGSDKSDESVALDRLERWRDTVAGGDDRLLAERLSWRGLTSRTVLPYLGHATLPPDIEPPKWATHVQAALSLGAHGGCDVRAPALPFARLLRPFVAVALDSARNGRRGNERLTTSAWASLVDILWNRLWEASVDTLAHEYSVFRTFHESGLRRIIQQSRGERPNGILEGFGRHLDNGGLQTLLFDYPVLARKIGLMMAYWVEFAREFLDRLEHDWRPLASHFFGGVDPGPVISVERLSDWHGRGRCVVSLRFATNTGRLIYKPRDVGAEHAIAQAVQQLNHLGGATHLRATDLLPRPGYGWVRYVEHLPCTTIVEVETFYEKSGMWLCLAYGLGATDLHCENVVAAGDNPVIVDLEALLGPLRLPVCGVGGNDRRSLAPFDSVLGTGLLPWWSMGQDGAADDYSGLGGVHRSRCLARRWICPDQDDVQIGWGYTLSADRANAVVLNGQTMEAADFREPIVRGFRTFYRRLKEHREVLLADSGALAGLSNVPIRAVLLSTSAYDAIARRASNLTNLRDGVDWSIGVDAVAARFLGRGGSEQAATVTTAEIIAMSNLDVPRLTVTADRESLTEQEHEGDLTAVFRGGGFRRLCDRLNELDADDERRQTDLVRAALVSSRGRVQDAPAACWLAGQEVGDSEAYLEEAASIADDVADRAVRDPAGGANWVAHSLLHSLGRFQLAPLNEGLYNGTTGVAVFLATVWKLTGTRRYRALAEAALSPVLVGATENPGAVVCAAGLGLSSGVGGLLLGLVRTAEALGDECHLIAAKKLAKQVTESTITADRWFDVIAGAAGAIFGLLAVYRSTGDRASIDAAVRCGEHLVQASDTGDGCRRWTLPGCGALAGMAHGAAGIALSLEQLYLATGNTAFVVAAQEAKRFERTLFDDAEGNWRDLRNADAREQGGPRFMTSWCHGAPGIGLARLAGLGVDASVEALQEMEVAVKATERFGPGTLDSLCCGSFGRIELLFEVGRRLKRPEAQRTAYKWASEVVDRARRSGRYLLSTGLRDAPAPPGLFAGQAGIGLELCHLAFPDRVPSLLTFGT